MSNKNISIPRIINKINKNIILLDEYVNIIKEYNNNKLIINNNESSTKYMIPHGIAVSIGMDMANRISALRGLTSIEHFNRMHTVLRKNYEAFSKTKINCFSKYFFLISSVFFEPLTG